MSEQPEPERPDLEASVQILRLEPGDVIIVSYPERLSLANAEAIKGRVRQATGERHEVVVVGPGVGFHLLREESPRPYPSQLPDRPEATPC